MTDDISALIERAVDTAFRRYVPTIIANPPPMLLEDRFVSVPEICGLLGINRSTLHRAGYMQSDLNKLLDQMRAAGKAAVQSGA